MQGKEHYRLRHAAGVYWLIQMDQQKDCYQKPLMLNECGAYIWECYQKDMPKEQIAEQMHLKYDIPVEEASADLKVFFNQLREQGI